MFYILVNDTEVFMEDKLEVVRDYVDDAVQTIAGINALPKKSDKKVIKERINGLLFAMGCIERAFKEFLDYKETTPRFDIKTAVQLDYDICSIANRLYKAAEYIFDVILMNSKAYGSIDTLFSKAQREFADLTNKMLIISARWDIERFITYYEIDTEPKERAYPKRKPLLQTPIFFMNRMNATKLGVEFADGVAPKRIIYAVQPSSGKSFIVNVYSVITLMLHDMYYHTSGILRMSNNSANAERFSTQIMGMIRNPKIADIYPEFAQYYVNGKCLLFDKENISEWKLKELDPKIGASHFARGRETAINSIRIFCALIIDDLSDGVEQMNSDDAHKQMWTKYQIDMESRKEDDSLPELIVGTMFNEFDIQNQVIRGLEERQMLVDSDKYTCTRHTKDFKTVVIAMDCFDDKGESVAPQLISTEKLKEKQENTKPYEFDLVYRQKRASREPRIFDWDNLKTYDTLPEGISHAGYASLDPTRKSGKDWFAVPVCLKDKNGIFYFVDCICKQKSLGNMSDPDNKFLDYVVNFIIKNNLVSLSLENNTSNTIGTLLQERLHARGYYSCKIDEFFSASNARATSKLERILNQESVITEYIRFPMRKNFSINSDMGKFMDMFTNFDSKNNVGKRNNPDDCCDSMAMFSAKYIFNTSSRVVKLQGISKNKIFG